MRATIPFPLHRFYASAAQLGFLPGYRPILDEFPRAPPVLEAGCGPGDVAIRLAQAQQVVGIDIDARMVKLAKKRHGDHEQCHFRVADVAHLPFKDAHFGAAWTSESFHHWEDQEAGVREIYRVLKPGGELWIVEARADMTRREFREGFGMPALPGLFGGLRRAFRKHGVTPESARTTQLLLEAVGFDVHQRPHGAWMVFVARKPGRIKAAKRKLAGRSG